MKKYVILIFILFISIENYSDINSENERAKKLLKKGDFDTARTIFENILKENTEYLPAIGSLIVLYEKEGEIEKEIEMLKAKYMLISEEQEKEKIVNRIKEKEEILKIEGDVLNEFAKAEECIREQKYSDALKIYDKFKDIKRKGVQEQINFGTGLCNYYLGNISVAETHFIKAKGYGSKYREEIVMYLCEIEYKKCKSKSWEENPRNKYQNVIFALKNMISSTKDKRKKESAKNLIVVCKNETGMRYLDLKQFDEGLTEFREAVRDYPESDNAPYIQYLMGHTYCLMSYFGKDEYIRWHQNKALEEYGKVYKNYKTNKEICSLALENMGCILGALEKKKEQKEVYELIIKEFPNTKCEDNAYYYLGQIYKFEGNWTKAKEYYDKIEKNCSGSAFTGIAKRNIKDCEEKINEEEEYGKKNK